VIGIGVKLTKTNWFPGAPREVKRENIAKMFYAMAETYWTRFTKLHFTRGAYARYGYRPRQGETGADPDDAPGGKWHKKSYTYRKWQKFHHMRPLVWSGETETRATTMKDVRSNSRRGYVVTHVPTLNRLKWAWGEFTRWTPDEASTCIVKGQRKADELIKNYRSNETEVISG